MERDQFCRTRGHDGIAEIAASVHFVESIIVGIVGTVGTVPLLTLLALLTLSKIVGTAARVQRGQTVISIKTGAESYISAKEALRKAGCKFPTPCSINVVEGAEHLKGLV